MRRGYMGLLCGVMVVCGVATMGTVLLGRPEPQQVTGPDLLNMPLELLMEVRIVSCGVESGREPSSVSIPTQPYHSSPVPLRLMDWS